MATSEAARLLTEQYRRQQLALRAAVVRRLLTAWAAFDLADIDRSWAQVEPLVLGAIDQGRTVASNQAAGYFQAFRTAEGVAGSVTPVLADPINPVMAQATLRVLGPIGTKKSIAAGAADVQDLAFVRVAGSVTRQVLNAGRETLLGSVNADHQALGWARAAGGRACSFCAMLASRGPVYKSDSSGGFRAHDHCACSVEPVYSRDAAWPDNSVRYAATWDQAKAQAREEGIPVERAFRHLIGT